MKNAEHLRTGHPACHVFAFHLLSDVVVEGGEILLDKLVRDTRQFLVAVGQLKHFVEAEQMLAAGLAEEGGQTRTVVEVGG